jgi:hypothetical protein
LEVIFAVSILTAALLLSDGLFVWAIRDVPRMGRGFQQDSMLMSALQRMQEDADEADAVGVDRPEDGHARLVFKSGGETIYYGINPSGEDGGRLERRMTGEDGRERPDYAWPVPDAHVEFRAADRTGGPVSIRCWVEMSGRRRFERSRLLRPRPEGERR